MELKHVPFPFYSFFHITFAISKPEAVSLPCHFFTAQYIHHSIVTTFCPLEKNLCKILWEDGSAAGCSCVPPGRHTGLGAGGGCLEGTLPLGYKRSGTSVVKDTTQGPAFLNDPYRKQHPGRAADGKAGRQDRGGESPCEAGTGDLFSCENRSVFHSNLFFLIV